MTTKEKEPPPPYFEIPRPPEVDGINLISLPEAVGLAGVKFMEGAKHETRSPDGKMVPVSYEWPEDWRSLYPFNPEAYLPPVCFVTGPLSTLILLGYVRSFAVVGEAHPELPAPLRSLRVFELHASWIEGPGLPSVWWTSGLPEEGIEPGYRPGSRPWKTTLYLDRDGLTAALDNPDVVEAATSEGATTERLPENRLIGDTTRKLAAAEEPHDTSAVREELEAKGLHRKVPGAAWIVVNGKEKSVEDDAFRRVVRNAVRTPH